MKFATRNRESNIELLRIVLMFMIITLHYNWPDMGKALAYAYNSDSNASFNFLWIMQNASLGAVNCFIIVSGYYSINRTDIKISKIINLLGSLCIYNLVAYFINCGINGFTNTFSLKSMISQSLPINYFLFLYIALYILAPYLNLVIDKLTKKQYKTMLIILICMFSVWEYGVDIVEMVMTGPLKSISVIGKQGDQGGYTIVNFILLYLIGAFFRKFDIPVKFKKKSLIVGYIGSVVCLSIINNMQYSNLIWQYNNPLVIIEACTLFLLFAKMKINTSKVINFFSSAMLGVFFLHVRSVFMQELWKESRIQESIENGLLSTIFTYISSIVVMFFAALAIVIIVNSTLVWIWNKVCSRVTFTVSVYEKNHFEE